MTRFNSMAEVREANKALGHREAKPMQIQSYKNGARQAVIELDSQRIEQGNTWIGRIKAYDRPGHCASIGPIYDRSVVRAIQQNLLRAGYSQQQDDAHTA